MRDQLIGSSALLVSGELRHPLIRDLQLGELGSLPPIDVVAFLEGGVAWDNSICMASDAPFTAGCTAAARRNVKAVWTRRSGQDPMLYRRPLFSWGVGLRLNVLFTILRLDYAIPLGRPDRRGIFSASFGPSFLREPDDSGRVAD